MGNCTARKTGKKTKAQGDGGGGDTCDTNAGKEVTPAREDVMYATINHNHAKNLGGSKTSVTDSQCDYATVKLPPDLEPGHELESETSREECADDYVLMGTDDPKKKKAASWLWKHLAFPSSFPATCEAGLGDPPPEDGCGGSLPSEDESPDTSAVPTVETPAQKCRPIGSYSDSFTLTIP
ncbi:uncharacterized protein si:ch211-214p13.7 [Lampris incognitus]|uniref:uncharacterized protein si:ch211-214p13.7 n=1 Tax=Lampris incognitus TaxID=2546036 RepID=UPI0024B4A493|nr:uncharacterized protein si:ch211-214p13.7 [Lampris incognitus]